ncbi:MAG: PASTA domain-containing protein [Dysgonamonadaceae bacterium]|jgi:beta-lactam-binding protein with PASTA domain|nr:PASTA domain-containing protein [Dysgonamonadaceae bacterium]
MNFFKKHPIIANLLLAALILCGLIIALLFWLDAYTHHGKSVEVPDVKGLRVEEAAPFFHNKSLFYVVADSQYVKKAKPGTIVETIPPIGTSVKEGRTIYLTISALTAKIFPIPDVMDMSQRQAVSLLNSSGFENVQVRTVPGAFRDLVVGLETSMGKKLALGDRIRTDVTLVLLVSSGTEAPAEIESTEAPEAVDDNWF